MSRKLTILDAMADPQLFGGWFAKTRTWLAWCTFLRALFGLPMTLRDLGTYKRHTGRGKAPKSQAREAWLVGRRGGKSFIVALIAVFLACFRDYRRHLAPGERATVMVLATDRRQARVIMRYVTALLEGVPMLRRLVERTGMESIDLSNSVTIEVHTASFRSVRGYTVAAAILDEIAFWRSEESTNPDSEIVAALRPAMKTIPGALLLGISSPYARRGVLWEAYRDYFGQDGDILVWQAASVDMNPTLSADEIEQEYAKDPVNAASEYGGQFRADVDAFLQSEWIDGAVRQGVHEIPPTPGVGYAAFADPSGGANDAFTLAIAHAEGKRLILDVCRARRAPFDPAAVTTEYAFLLKRYGITQVTGDRYSAEWVVSAFRQHGINYVASERTKSDIYLETVPLFATGAIQLLDNRVLVTELRQLERRTGRGKDVVDHPPRGHDDQANAACGALLHVISAPPADFMNGAHVDETGPENRAERDEHLTADLGYAGEVNTWDSPFDLK